MKLKEEIGSHVSESVAFVLNDGDGFWYGLTQGGYIKPEELLGELDAEKVREATKVLRQFEGLLSSRFPE